MFSDFIFFPLVMLLGDFFFFCILHYSCTVFFVSYFLHLHFTEHNYLGILQIQVKCSFTSGNTFITVDRYRHKKNLRLKNKVSRLTQGPSEACCTFSALVPLFLPFSPSLCYWPLGLVNFFLPLVRLTLCMPLSCWEGKPSLLSYRDFAAVLD